LATGGNSFPGKIYSIRAFKKYFLNFSKLLLMKKLFTLTLIGLVLSFAAFAVVGPITGPSSVCVGSTITLADTTAGGTWASSSGSIATVGSLTGIVTGNTAGIVNISYIAPGGTVVKTITVNGVPAAIGGGSTVCMGQTTTLTNTTSGGSWTSSDISLAAVGVTNGVVSGLAAGTVTITYTTVCGAVYKTVSVNASPDPITGPTTLCISSTITLANVTAGGTWTSANTARATVGSSSGVVTGVTAGTVLIDYTQGGCTVTKLVTVTSSPAALSGPSSVCAGATITLASVTSGGIWSSSSASTATVGATTGIVTGVTGGVVTISYVVGGCGSVVKNVTINAAPTAIVGASSVCLGSSITLTNPTVGGAWSISDPSIATIGVSTGIVNSVTAGVVTVTYAAGGCNAYKTVTVIDVEPITGMSSVCTGSSITLANTVAGGTWTSSTTSVATVGASTGIVNGTGIGTTTITYTAGGCISTTVVTVTSVPTPITGPGSVCQGATITLANATAGGSWYSANPLTATVDSTTGVVNGVSVGFATIYYSLPGCGNVLKTISVNATPAAITSPGTVCTGSTITLTDASAGGTWTTSSVAIATIGSTTGAVSGVTTGTVTISYILGGCSVSTIVSVVAPTPIMGSSSVCVGSTITLTNSVTGGTWATSNATIGTIDTAGIVAGINPGNVIISYRTPGCTATMIVTVVAVPAAVTGASSVCSGSTITLGNTVSGGSWSSSDITVATIGSASGILTGVAGGIVTITYSTGSCGSAFRNVTVNQTPAAIVGGSIMCAGSSITLTDSIVGGSWSSGNTLVATVGAASGIVTSLTSGTVNISYTIGGCFVYKTLTITATTAPITGPSNVCAGASITLADATSGGSWTSASTAIATIGSGSGIVTGASAGIVTISYLVTGCTGVAKNITVNAAPGVVTGPDELCVAATIILADATPGGVWTSSNPSIATIVPTTGLVTSISSGTVIMSYTTAGCSSTKIVTVTAVPPPIVGSSVLCTGTSATFTDAATGGTWGTWYSSTVAVATIDSATGFVDAVSPGTTIISYYYGGCTVTKILTVTLTPDTITGTGEVCSGKTITLADATTGGIWTSSNLAVGTIDPGTGIFAGLSGGFSTISYILGTCSVSMLVTVNETPPAITGSNVVCTSLTATLSNTLMGGAWSSSGPEATVDAAGVVTGAMVGTVTISYTRTGCITSKVITVSACAGKISGMVTEIIAGGSYPVGAVMIDLRYVSTGTTAKTVYTNLAGMYEFNTLPEDSYYVYPSAPGYVTVPSGVITIGGATLIVGNVNFELNRNDSTIVPLVNAVNNVNASGKIHVYPNPTSGALNIKWEDKSMTDATITVTDVTGRVISTATVNNNNRNGVTRVDMSGLSNGIYMVNVKSEDMNSVYKVSVQR
jgi:uncharacterized protein YjdB